MTQPFLPIAQLQAALGDISPRQDQIRALTAQMEAFDEQLAALEAALHPLLVPRSAVATSRPRCDRGDNLTSPRSRAGIRAAGNLDESSSAIAMADSAQFGVEGRRTTALPRDEAFTNGRPRLT